MQTLATAFASRMSESGPGRPTYGARRHYRAYTGRAADAFGTAARDPGRVKTLCLR